MLCGGLCQAVKHRLTLPLPQGHGRLRQWWPGVALQHRGAGWKLCGEILKEQSTKNFQIKENEYILTKVKNEALGSGVPPQGLYLRRRAAGRSHYRWPVRPLPARAGMIFKTKYNWKFSQASVLRFLPDPWFPETLIHKVCRITSAYLHNLGNNHTTFHSNRYSWYTS